jgi:hypothetical protein
LITCGNCDAQWTLVVRACETQAPLANATVIVGRETMLADEHGRVKLTGKAPVEVRFTGYQPRRVQPRDTSVCLELRDFMLDSVSIRPRKVKEVVVGYRPKYISIFRFHDLCFPVEEKFYLLKPLQGKPAYVKSGRFYFHNYDSLPGSKQAHGTFELRIFSAKATSRPDSLVPDSLLVSGISVTPTQKGESHITVDLTRYGLILPPEGLYLSLKSKEVTGGHYDKRTGKPYKSPNTPGKHTIPSYVKHWGTYISGTEGQDGPLAYVKLIFKGREYISVRKSALYPFFSLSTIPLEY